MIHPTRTNLLMLKEKSRSVVNSIGILKARKQALIKEFLTTTLPFLRSREDIKKSYGRALRELAISLGREGEAAIASISVATEREFGIEVEEEHLGAQVQGHTVSRTAGAAPGQAGILRVQRHTAP
jgi:V/A-type H+-transporting ATPase subunit D